MSNKVDPVTNARAITASLRRSANTMGSNVSSANAAVGALAEDGDSIRETLNEHKVDLKQGLVQTKLRLSKVKTIEQRERMMIWSSVAFFTIVAFYIIAKRTRLLTLLYLLYSGANWGSDLIQRLYHQDQGPSNLTESDYQRALNNTLIDGYAQPESKAETSEQISLKSTSITNALLIVDEEVAESVVSKAEADEPVTVSIDATSHIEVTSPESEALETGLLDQFASKKENEEQVPEL